MNIRNELASLVLVGNLAFGVGCKDYYNDSDIGSTHSSRQNPTYSETISGVPLSVETGFTQYWTGLQVVLNDGYGSSILCKAAEGWGVDNSGSSIGHRKNKYLAAKTIIQSEINDSDNEPITLQGSYYGDEKKECRFISVSANGLTVSGK
ncbi:MAG: hypothetical protein IH845_03560 [Nanoarchaeota archaeon]|nr:hypothetical protein [Nanoarchaeota archaeon]